MQTQTQTQAQTLADTLASSFETRERQDMFSEYAGGGGVFHALKDNAPQWIADAVRAAHGDRLPCDWIYKQCDNVASDIRQAILHEDICPEDLDIRPEADIYTATLTAWLADDIRNLDYCNQWADEFAELYKGYSGTGDLCAMISGGQWLAKQEIAGAMVQAYLTELEAQE